MMNSNVRKVALVAAILAAVVVVAGVVVGLFIAPQIAKDEVSSRLERVEAKTGVQIELGALETNMTGGVTVTDIVATDEAGRVVARVETASASVAVFRLLMGEKVVSDLSADGVKVFVHRDAEGHFTLLDQLRSKRGESTEGESEGSGDGGGILRYFGGQFPDVALTNVSVEFVADDGAKPFPLESAHVPEMTIDGGDVATIEVTATVKSTPSDSWTVPSEVTLFTEIDTDFAPQKLDLTFDKPAEIGGIEPLPYLRVGLAGASIEPDYRLQARGLQLGFDYADEPFARAEVVRVDLQDWTTNPAEVRILDLVIEKPRLDLTYDRLGASALNDLNHLIRGPRARNVAANARTIASAIAEKSAPPSEPVDPDAPEPEAEPEEPEDDAKPSKRDWVKLVIDRAPQHIGIVDAEVHVVDDRGLPVARPARKLSLSEATLEVTHRPLQQEFNIEGSFVASADGKPRGKGTGKLDWGYGKRTIDAGLDIDTLDLSFAAQLLGPRVAKHVRGGVLRAKLNLAPQKGRAVTFEGFASVENLIFDWSKLAEEPITDFTASYGFQGIYNPDGKVPEARLLKEPLFKEGFERPKGVTKGSLVFTKGAAEVNGVKASVKPALYGTAALPSNLPARFDMTIKLAKTPVMNLFNAVPKALLGPLQGTQMSGSFTWDFDVEVPLYRAGDMEWLANPVVEEFALLSIPEEVDVRKLETGMTHTITDEWGPGDEIKFERTIKIPEMKPVPASWLLENSEVELAKIDEVRRRREWPPLPENPAALGMSREYVNSPQYWLSPHAEAFAAPRPWVEGEEIQRTEEQPYGRYVFVPLQHISKWMTRAVLTTEDNSFFKHNGINYFALKESVEDNLEAGRFRRGASTISMQLVKNVFLDQKKLLARKLREAFLVWLMEVVVDVPKPRLLEVYFNVIEFGPGIFGIHDAAVHYFGKRPSDLTLGEVAWLVSIVPNPKKYHFYWERGEITPHWFKRMSRYINVMHNRERATLEERDKALEAAPLFYKPKEDEPVLRPDDNFIMPLLDFFETDEPEPTPPPTPFGLPD